MKLHSKKKMLMAFGEKKKKPWPVCIHDLCCGTTCECTHGYKVENLSRVALSSIEGHHQ